MRRNGEGYEHNAEISDCGVVGDTYEVSVSFHNSKTITQRHVLACLGQPARKMSTPSFQKLPSCPHVIDHPRSVRGHPHSLTHNRMRTPKKKEVHETQR